jgi:Carbohydrate-selective porin, OprB family/S-layer homology domain
MACGIGLTSGAGFTPIAAAQVSISVEPSVPGSIAETSAAISAETGAETSTDPLMQKLPTVDELSDLTPEHWAYKYVKSLNDRYNLLTGYPDNTFRGNQPFTRYEFVAVLAKVFERAELFKEERQEDLNALKRLTEFYRTALADLRIRMDGLTERGTQLEQQNVSATTKLNTQVIQTLTNGTGAKLTAMSRLRLDLQSSFTGRDRLVTEFEFGTQGGDAIANAQTNAGNRLGTIGKLVDGGGLQEVGTAPQGQLRKLYYEFPLGQHLNLAVGSALPPSDFVDHNRFANSSGSNFASSFFANNPLIVQNDLDRFGGAGVAVSWQATHQLTLRGLYTAADANRPQPAFNIGPCTAPPGALCAPTPLRPSLPPPQGGLFGDRYQGTIEAEFQPSAGIATRLQYTNAKINGTDINALGVNAEWLVSREFAVFGRYGIGNYQGLNTQLLQNLNLQPHSWMVGGTLRNFLLTGSTVGLAIGQPFVTGNLGNATQTNTEAYFSFLLNDKINLIPSLQIVTNPDNQKGKTIWQWAIRMVLDF